MEQQQQKALGAFYTNRAAVDFLVDWALRGAGDRCLDPSCGDGRFLSAALAGGAGEAHGLDVNPEAIAVCRRLLAERRQRCSLAAADFFTVAPEALPAFDAVIGNPPFVRYQRFGDASRTLALASALRLGVRLTRLTSTWAPFLLHAAQFLRPGGRLAMVVPAEITQTQYGLPTLNALLAHFASVTLIAFDRNLFSEVQAETYLLLADGYGGRSRSVKLIPLADAKALSGLTAERLEVPDQGHSVALDQDARFIEAFLSSGERRAWNRLKADRRVVPLAQLGTVSNGYVSGDNQFFHRSRADAGRLGLPEDWLLPTARNARTLVGLDFTAADLDEQEQAGRALHLVVPQVASDLDSEPLQRFCREGEQRGTQRRYKCRTRNPWWKVPGLSRPDVLLTYMTGSRPRAVVNRVDALFSNSLHGLHLEDPSTAEAVALLFHNSLTLLSHEIEGRSYGGGILKLEPTEMASVRVPTATAAQRPDLFDQVDALLRAQQYEQAIDVVDEAVLRQQLRISRADLAQVDGARCRLRERRNNRNKRHPPEDR